MHRVVVDASVLLLGLTRKGGAADGLQRAWRAQRFALVTSNQQLEEMEDAGRHPKLQPHVDPAELRHWLDDVRRRAFVLAAFHGWYGMRVTQADALVRALGEPVRSAP